MIKYLTELFFVFVGVGVIVANILFIPSTSLAYSMVNLAGALVAVLPSLFLFYSHFRSRKQMEEQFMVFIGDLNEAIDSGMTLPIALQSSSKKDYLALNAAVQSLAAQVDWGIPFQKAFLVFGYKRVPIAAPDDLQDIPASTSKGCLKLLNDFSITPNRAV